MRLSCQADKIYKTKMEKSLMDIIKAELTEAKAKVNLKRLLARFLCYLFSHKISEANDSGYAICSRCGCHEYYDSSYYTNKWDDAGWLVKPIWWVQRKYYDTKYYWKHKYERWRDGDDGLPF